MDLSQLLETSKVRGKGKGKGKSSAENKTVRLDSAEQELKQAACDPGPCLPKLKTDDSQNEELHWSKGHSECTTEEQNTLTSQINTGTSNTVSVIVSNPKIIPTADLKSNIIVDRPSSLATDVKNVEHAKKVLFPDEPEQPEDIGPIITKHRSNGLSVNEELLKSLDASDINSDTIETTFKHLFKKRSPERQGELLRACADNVRGEDSNSGCDSFLSQVHYSRDFHRDESIDGSDMESKAACVCLPHCDYQPIDMSREFDKFDCIKKLCRKRSYKKLNCTDSSPTKKFCANDSYEDSPDTSQHADSSANPIALNIPSPPELKQWLNHYETWSSTDKNLALDALVKSSTILQVRHMMKSIEPIFQTDFISLLPKELALIVLSYLEPKDLAKVGQTCFYWRILANDHLLWKRLCHHAGISPDRQKEELTFYRPHWVNPYKWAFMNQHIIERNWMTRSSSEAIIMRGHDDHVITCLQCDGDRIVSGSDDTTLKVWSTVTGECLLTLFGHSGGVWSCQMTHNIIVSGSTDRTLRVWNADTGVCLNTLGGHTSTVRCMRLFEDKVVSGSRDATLRVWSIPEGRCLRVLVGHMAAVRCVQYDGKLVISGAYDFFVKIWNPDTGECLHTLAGHNNRVYSLQFDGSNVVSGSLDTSICVWDATTGQLKHTLLGHTSLITSMELHGNILISGNADSTLKVWDISTGQCLHTLAGSNKHQSAVTYVQSTNRFVISSSDDGTVKLWDLRTGEFIRNIVQLGSGGAGGNVLRIRASNTRLVCAVGSRNGTEETKLMLMNFDRRDSCHKCSEYCN